MAGSPSLPRLARRGFAALARLFPPRARRRFGDELAQAMADAWRDERVREIGIRMALGAEPSMVRALVLADGLRVAAAGIGLGLAVAVASTRVLAGMLYEVTATDPITLAAVPLVLVAVAALAAYLPAWRASRVDPIVSLRVE